MHAERSSTPSRGPGGNSSRWRRPTGRAGSRPWRACSRPRGSGMSLWRQIRAGLRVLTDRRAADLEMADELRHYLDQATAAAVARGLSPADAWRAAQAECGTLTVVREQVRMAGWENTVNTVATDIRYAVRRLRANPGFTLVAGATLALGIGATTAIFSAVYPILFESLPYPDANRID